MKSSRLCSATVLFCKARLTEMSETYRTQSALFAVGSNTQEPARRLAGEL
jgi:hypothetical protein